MADVLRHPDQRFLSDFGPHVVGEGTLLDGRYRLDELIGRGGTADVYRGIDDLLGRAVAIKVFDVRLTDLNTIVRQRNEMQVLARLTHPNLIAVYDARIAEPGEFGGHAAARTYLVLELVLGYTLADLIMQGPIPPAEVNRIGLTLASVLEVVHEHDLVHRDIKPANVLLAETGQIKLGDFGLARILTAENRLTTGADVMGTAAYFSPEQARAGVVGPPADIYSLGLVLLECLTGQKEFPGEAVSAAVARLLRDPTIPDTLPAPWPVLLTAMTRSDPQLRPTAGQVRAILAAAPLEPGYSAGESRELQEDRLVADAPTVAWSSPMTPFLFPPAFPTDRSRRRRRPVVLGLGAAIAIAAIAIGMSMRADTQAPAANPEVHSDAAHPTSPTAGPPSGDPRSNSTITARAIGSLLPTQLHQPAATRTRPATTRPSMTATHPQVISTARPVAAVTPSSSAIRSTANAPAPVIPSATPHPTSTNPAIPVAVTPAVPTTPTTAHPGNANGRGKPKPPKKSKK